MKKNALCIMFILLCSSPLWAGDIERRPMTVDDALNMIRLSDVHMSPDAKWVFFSKSELNWAENRRKKKYFMIPTSGGGAVEYIGDAGGRSFQFSPDGRFLSFLRTVDKKSQIFIMSLSGGEAIQLTRHQNNIDAYKWSGDATHI
ncbi:MAG: TolB family protein [Candidatus Aminicenantales bacterium]